MKYAINNSLYIIFIGYLKKLLNITFKINFMKDFITKFILLNNIIGKCRDTIKYYNKVTSHKKIVTNSQKFT